MIPVPVHRRCIMTMESVDRRVQEHPLTVPLLIPRRVLHRVPRRVPRRARHRVLHRVLLTFRRPRVQ